MCKFFFDTEIESSEKKTRGKKNIVLEGVKEKIKEIIKHLKTKFKLEKIFFNNIEDLAIESVEQEEQDLVDPEEHAPVIVLALLSLTCRERKYRLYRNMIREKFWINQKVLEQTISDYKQKLQTYGVN